MHSRSFQRPRRRAGQVTATMVPPVSVGEFTIDFFEDDDARSPVEEWMDSDLADLELAALLFGLEHVLRRRGGGVCQTEKGKQLGEGFFEFRIRHTSAEIEHMFTGRHLVARQPSARRSCSLSSVMPAGRRSCCS